MATGLFQLLAAFLATAGLLAVAGIVQSAAFFINLLLPLPIALLTLRRGAPTGLLAVLLCAGLVGAGGDAANVVVYLIQAVTASLLLPQLLRQGWLWDRALVATLLTTVAALIMLVVAESRVRGLSIEGLVDAYAVGEVAQVKKLFVDANDELQPAQRDELLKSLESARAFLVRAWPAILTLIAAVFLMVQVLLLKLLPATRLLVQGEPFALWKAPDLLVWPLIVAGFVTFLATGVVQDVAINLLVLLLPVYYLQGMAIVTYFFQQRGTPVWLRLPGYLLLAFFNPLPVMVAGIGLFDLWGDFRKPRQENKE